MKEVYENEEEFDDIEIVTEDEEWEEDAEVEMLSEDDEEDIEGGTAYDLMLPSITKTIKPTRYSFFTNVTCSRLSDSVLRWKVVKKRNIDKCSLVTSGKKCYVTIKARKNVTKASINIEAIGKNCAERAKDDITFVQPFRIDISFNPQNLQNLNR